MSGFFLSIHRPFDIFCHGPLAKNWYLYRSLSRHFDRIEVFHHLLTALFTGFTVIAVPFKKFGTGLELGQTAWER